MAAGRVKVVPSEGLEIATQMYLVKGDDVSRAFAAKRETSDTAKVNPMATAPDLDPTGSEPQSSCAKDPARIVRNAMMKRLAASPFLSYANMIISCPTMVRRMIANA